jgi:hypothetical protein
VRSAAQAFDVCRGALALRALLAVNGAVLLAVLAGAGSFEQALADTRAGGRAWRWRHAGLAGLGLRAAVPARSLGADRAARH